MLKYRENGVRVMTCCCDASCLPPTATYTIDGYKTATITKKTLADRLKIKQKRVTGS